ncbi:phosphonate degradation HD-domain oxygenase [Chitinophaga sp. GbtcB8]|jgi:phosphonate degradation associated HDIG domain protein|uniref:phosphonate degradation HD-domain oxygenase n=1 Tax=Chitinophaga sp. GbtcB8 TaxID=2824753 RepID=UPI001C306320|nr:phosphonate degradation HD-domain oxygenase [Chitinophaga sp. GbtcB8]
MLLQQAEQTVSTIFSLYEKYGAADYIGEPVSQLEHMCQAALLAEQAGSREEVILAAFFHDIGHLCEMEGTASMGGYGVQDHEKWGGIFLKQHGFSDALIRLVGSHVDAKRYLTFKYPTYYAQLSEASKQTLAYQGGPMTETEAAAFEADPLFADMVRLRTWDDQAKATDQPLPDLQRFKQMALHHLMNQ